MASTRWTWALGVAVVGTMAAPPVWAADAGSDAGDDGGDAGNDAGLVCPNPAVIPASYAPPAYVHAVPHQNACSAQLIADYYAQCLDTASTAQTCAPWTNGADSAHLACEACLVTPSTASAYGPVVQMSFGNFLVNETNIAGCIELADLAGLSCATKLQDREDCDDTACAAQCPVSDDPSFNLWQQCLNAADLAASSCLSYYDATSCAQSEMPDGGVAAACFSTVANPTFEDDYNAIAPVFCLDLAAGADGGATDAGGGGDAGNASDGGTVGTDGGTGGSDAGLADGGSSSGGSSSGSDSGPVTTPVDGGGGNGSDGGASPSKSSSGCSCDTAAAAGGGPALLALAGAVFLAGARRRKR